MFSEVFWRQMRVAADHGRGLPTARFLQDMQRSPGLDVPTGPCMPQVVPPEIVDAGTHQCLSPCLGIGLQDRLSIEREHHGGFRPICSRTTASASLFSGTGIAFLPFAWLA